MYLEKVLKNKNYHKILKFFHENPASIDTARGVAAWTGQDIKGVRSALKKLAELNLLTMHKVSSTIGYSYTQDKKKISEIKKFFKK